ncbi:MAG: T9SS type A sorting domain-containing protein [Candidatus Kapabacteria bacterium]|nr:T9SS type A sorting domain-containing protein [Candidatus Kapabacteria bacterium]
MKKASFALSFFFIFISFSFLKAEFWKYNLGSFSVGKQPVGFIYDDMNKTINIFCAGYDANFDGAKGDEDKSPSWWQASLIEPNNPESKIIEEPYLVKEFEFGSFQFPFRPGYSYPMIYYSSNNIIETYNIGNAEKVANDLPGISSSAITANKNYLLISHRPSFTEPGYVHIFDLTKNLFIDTLNAGVNVQQTFFYKNEKIIVLNEGDFGAANSSVQIFKKNGEKYELEKNIITGDGSNHITIVNDILIVTNNASHDLTIIDLTKNEILKKIKLPTEGFSGPRETIYSPKLNQIITSTYNGKVYVHNFEGDLLETIETEGNPEGLLLIESPVPLLFVANEFIKESYEPNSSFQIFSNKVLSKDEISNNKPEFILNSFTNTIEINNTDFQNNYLSIMIFNSLGKLIHKEQKILSEIKISIDLSSLNLANGSYFLIIQDNFITHSYPFILAK